MPYAWLPRLALTPEKDDITKASRDARILSGHVQPELCQQSGDDLTAQNGCAVVESTDPTSVMNGLPNVIRQVRPAGQKKACSSPGSASPDSV